MLRAMQRVKSEGDFAVGKALVESNGVKVDRDLYREVLQQVEPFGLAPGSGFVDPVPEPVTDSKGETPASGRPVQGFQ